MNDPISKAHEDSLAAISRAQERWLQPPEEMPEHEFERLDNFPAMTIVCAICLQGEHE